MVLYGLYFDVENICIKFFENPLRPIWGRFWKFNRFALLWKTRGTLWESYEFRKDKKGQKETLPQYSHWWGWNYRINWRIRPLWWVRNWSESDLQLYLTADIWKRPGYQPIQYQIWNYSIGDGFNWKEPNRKSELLPPFWQFFQREFQHDEQLIK